MNSFTGKTLSWSLQESIVELELHRPPANEIGTDMLGELEQFIAALDDACPASERCDHPQLTRRRFFAPARTCASSTTVASARCRRASAGVREFLHRIHAVLNALDDTPLTTIAAVHGVCFGGGFELALACDLIIADKMARFCFPELRLGLIPGFGGIPRLQPRSRQRSGARFAAHRAQHQRAKASAVGLVSQVAAEGEASRGAGNRRASGKFDRATSAAAKRFLKPIPREELRREIDFSANSSRAPR